MRHGGCVAAHCTFQAAQKGMANVPFPGRQLLQAERGSERWSLGQGQLTRTRAAAKGVWRFGTPYLVTQLGLPRVEGAWSANYPPALHGQAHERHLLPAQPVSALRCTFPRRRSSRDENEFLDDGDRAAGSLGRWGRP